MIDCHLSTRRRLIADPTQPDEALGNPRTAFREFFTRIFERSFGNDLFTRTISNYHHPDQIRAI